MSPLSRRLVRVGQRIVQLVPHADNPLRHTLHLTLPLSIQLRLAQDGVGDQRTMQRRVRVHWPDDDLDLTVHLRPLLRPGGGERKRTDTLAVETHVLSEGLGEGNLVALGDEVTNGLRVAGGRAGREALVGHVEEGEKLFLLHDVGNFGPLFWGGVDTRRVVCTGMEQDNRLLGSVLWEKSLSITPSVFESAPNESVPSSPPSFPQSRDRRSPC